MTASDFVNRLTADVPDAGEVVAQHLADNDGELLIHLLLPDLLRYCVRVFHGGDGMASARCLSAVSTALVGGDEHLRNAVQVSFVEYVGAEPGETSAFIATWPQPLLDELAEQRSTCSW